MALPFSNFSLRPTVLPSEPGAPFPQDQFNPWTAAIKSLGWAAGPGLIGLEANNPDIVKFKSDYPVASALVDVAGTLTPYVGWGGIAAKIPKMAKLIEGVASADKLERSPFIAGAMREIVRFAPLEATRVASNAFLGDQLAARLDAYNQGVGTVSEEALANLAIGGVVGGTFEKIMAGGGGIFKKREPATLYPGLDQADPAQIQLRKLGKALAGASPEDSTKIAAAMNGLKTRIVNEVPLKKSDDEPTRALRSVFSSKTAGRDEKQLAEDARQLNRWFRIREKQDRGVTVARLSVDGLGSQEGYQKALATAELPENFHQFVQFPRVLRANTTKTAEAIQDSFVKKLDSVDARAWIGRDGENGLYVVAKKLSPTLKKQQGDEWLIFKTDNPGQVFPTRESWQKSVLQRNAWMVDEFDPSVAKTGVPIFDEIAAANKDISAADFTAMEHQRGTGGKTVDWLMKKAGVDPGNSMAYQKMAAFANEYISPAMTQFIKSPLAQKLWMVAKRGYDTSKQMGEEMYHGAATLDATKPWKAFLGSDFGAGITHASDSIATALRGLYDEPGEVAKALLAIRQNLSVDDAIKELGLGPRAVKALQSLQRVDDTLNGMELKVEKHSGLGESKRFAPLPNHYLLSNTWRGDWRTRVQVRGNGGWRTMFVGGGEHPAESAKAAEFFSEKMKDSGMEVRVGQTVQSGELEADRALRQEIAKSQQDPLMRSLYKRIQGTVYKPDTYKVRAGVGGFIGEDRPLTLTEFGDIVKNHIAERTQRMAGLSFESQMWRQKAILANQDPATSALLHKRIEMLKGRQGPVSKLTNAVADKLLSPYLGKNSASKIVSTANSAMFALELGFANTSYVLANALTFMQTSLPMIAFVTSAAPERVAQHYSFFPIQGRKAVGHIGVLNILKLTGQSFKDLVKPSEELQGLLQRGTKEGVWDPKFVEDTVGENSRVAGDIRGALKGEDGFPRFIKAVSQILPGASEKFSRGHSFVMGYGLGKLVNLEGEHLYQFAKEFTEKTMFNYSAADRPLVITGPFGSAFGLFKNWMMHYMNWALTFAGEGVKYGNWKPLMWMGAGTTAIGGVPALAGYGGVDALQKMFTNEGLMHQIYSTFGGSKEEAGLGDGIYYGLPGLLGFSLQNQVSMPFADPARDVSQMFGLAYWDRMKAFGKMVGDGYDNIIASGRHPAEDKHFVDSAIRAFAPKAIFRASSVDWGFSNAIHSLSTGYPVVDKLPIGQRLLYIAGVNPRQIELGYEVGNELWKDANKRLAAIQAFGKDWADATENQDYAKMREISYRTVVNGIDMHSVIASANSRLAKGREAMIERQFSPEAIYDWRKLGLY